MTRVLSLVFILVVGGALFLLPDPPTYSLAALEAGNLLSEPAGQPGAEDRELWQSLAESDAVSRAADGELTIRLAGVLVRDETAAVDPHAHGEALQSVVRAWRTILQGKESAFELEGTTKPYTGELPSFGLTLLYEPGQLRLECARGGEVFAWSEKDWNPPTRKALFPPLLAILVAVLFRKPILALLSGVLIGAVLARLRLGAGLGESVLSGLPAVGIEYFWNELKDTDRAEIIGFVIFMLAMVGIMTRAGGIQGLMNKIAGIAGTVRSTQIATWLMGLAIFFDDYANSILVGTTMRPLTDKLRIAREKLAYIVDSTAAPVAGISIFSTWIAFEVSTFSAQLPDAGLTADDGYRVFLQTMPYRFYCYFTLFFVGLVTFTGRDWGPMLRAERRARGGALVRVGGRPMVGGSATELGAAEGVTPAARRALLPLVVFIGVTLLEMARGGGAHKMSLSQLFSLEGMTQVLYEGSGSWPLLIGSLAGMTVAGMQALAAGLRSDIPRAAWNSLRSMGVAIAILYLAWMIGAVCRDVGTAPYLTVLLNDALNPLLLPCILFLLSGVVAFSTGSSWSTMTILLPLVVGLAYGLGNKIPLGGEALMILSIGSVLEGAIFGDHCSPISDTTVMSSIATASDHVDHVRTQAPYAVLTMSAALGIGYFPCTFLGLHPFIALIAGFSFLTAVVFWFGRRVESEPTPSPAPSPGNPG